jgi:hypothetical protein
MTDPVSDLFDTLALIVGLVVIAWMERHASRRTSDAIHHPVAASGMLVWLATFVFALYLIFG